MCFLSADNSDWLCPGLKRDPGNPSLGLQASQLARANLLSSQNPTATTPSKFAATLADINAWLKDAKRSDAAIKAALNEAAKILNLRMSDLLASSEFDETAKLAGVSSEDLLASSESSEPENLSPEEMQDLAGLSGDLKSSLAEKGISLDSSNTSGALEMITGNNGL
ncbi:MAG: hypothetical protein ACJAYS_000635, partial [Lentimonas sp.]